MSVKHNDCFILNRDIESTVFISWAAPVGLSHPCLLPAGTPLVVLADAADGASAVEVQPLYVRAGEVLLVPEDDRLSSRYRGYSLVMSLDEIGVRYMPASGDEVICPEEEWRLAVCALYSRRERREGAFRGLLAGTAVADAVALPYEGLGPGRIARMLRGELNHRFLLGLGMVSDDTDHAVIVAQSMLEAQGDLAVFRRSLARRLRWWMASLPGGIGLATLKSIVRLWCCISPEKSGVFSAGNAPAMRVAVLGACYPDDDEKLKRFVEAATVISHTDPRALTGALAVARTAAWIVREAPVLPPTVEDFAALLRACGDDAEWQRAVVLIEDSIRNGHSLERFAGELGIAADKGVSGYVYQTVPVALYAWFRHFNDYRATVEQVVRLGGDTDTVAAIAGALAGAVCGEHGIPDGWRARLVDWPNGTRRLYALADVLSGKRQPAAGLLKERWLGSLVRNMLFDAIVLLHGFRRLLPP